jgi:SiaC family regulatory phosphoprotein
MTYSIEGQRRSLKVDINDDTGIFLFAGVSLPENTNAFFEPVLDEISAYMQKPKEKTIVNFYVEYLNTSSALYLRRIVMLCEENLGNDRLEVNWHFEKDDDDIKDFGEDFKSIFKKIDIKLIEISENPFT